MNLLPKNTSQPPLPEEVEELNTAFNLIAYGIQIDDSMIDEDEFPCELRWAIETVAEALRSGNHILIKRALGHDKPVKAKLAMKRLAQEVIEKAKMAGDPEPTKKELVEIFKERCPGRIAGLPSQKSKPAWSKFWEAIGLDHLEQKRGSPWSK